MMRWIWGLLVLLVLLAGCGGAASQATPVAEEATGTPAATKTVQPTGMATGTATTTPTASPTATPTPSLTPLPTALPAPRPTSAAPPDQSIRSTDWEAMLGAQPTALPGYVFDWIKYADLDGDGVEEALVPYHSGGTAGIYYYTVFRQTASGPVEVGGAGGEEVGVAMQDGYLVAQTFVRAGWEANCCASGKLLTGYTLRGDVLEPVAQWHMGDTSMARWMLSLYFSIWDQQRYPNAYTFLDDSIRAQVSFDQWRQDRQHIEPDDVEISFTPPLTTTDTLQPLGTVLTATITMTGQYTPPGGRPETRYYTGTWPIAYRPFALEYTNGHVHESYGWVILTDTLNLVPVSLAPPPPTPTATRAPRPTRTPIPTPTTPAFHITAYTFADADHGWLAIDQKLWHTSDGGATWQPQFDLPEPAEQIVFTAPQQGWIATATGYLVTDDGGATWQPTNDSGPLHRPRWYREHCSGGTSRPASISFINDQQGWLLCLSEPATGHQRKQVLYTNDAGQTWTAQLGRMPSFGVGASIFFLDAQQGWLTTGLGRVYHTTNGGRSWQPWGNVVIEAVRTKTQPFFLSEQHGFIVFWPSQGTNLLVRTTDGGQTWEQIYP